MALGVAELCLFLHGLAGFPLGVAVRVMARRGQEKIHAGLMDADGRGAVEVARRWAINGLVLCLLSGVVWGLLLYQALSGR